MKREIIIELLGLIAYWNFRSSEDLNVSRKGKITSYKRLIGRTYIRCRS